MSGHSKWSTIKRQKSANDATRGKIFTKLGSAITIAVKEGGSADREANFRLRLMMDKARQANMPRENIDRAIKRASGKTGESKELHEVLYEGFGPEGIAVLAEGVTDNKQRTASAVKNIFSAKGGHLAGVGSVVYQFTRVGEIHLGKVKSMDEMLEQALAAGALDIEEEPDRFIVYVSAADLAKVRDYFVNQHLSVLESELVYRPVNPIKVSDQATATKMLEFLSALDELDEIHKIYANYETTL